MGVSVGMVIFLGGIVGMIASIVVLCFLPGIFRKQKNRLLKELEEE